MGKDKNLAQIWAQKDSEALDKAFQETLERVHTEKEEQEEINHPHRYNLGKHECIDEMLALFGKEAVIGFCKCNVYKYKYRAEAKGGDVDRQKAEWYMDYLMKLEGME